MRRAFYRGRAKARDSGEVCTGVWETNGGGLDGCRANALFIIIPTVCFVGSLYLQTILGRLQSQASFLGSPDGVCLFHTVGNMRCCACACCGGWESWGLGTRQAVAPGRDGHHHMGSTLNTNFRMPFMKQQQFHYFVYISTLEWRSFYSLWDPMESSHEILLPRPEGDPCLKGVACTCSCLQHQEMGCLCVEHLGFWGKTLGDNRCSCTFRYWLRRHY